MPSARRRSLLAAGVVVGLAATSLAWTSATAAPAAAPAAAGPTRAVIVLLRDQHTDLPAGRGMSSPRALAARGDQAPLLAAATASGGRDVHGFNLINGFSASLTAAGVDQLAANPEVAAILPDLPITRPARVRDTAVAPGKAGAAGNPDPAVCPGDPSKPLLEPEALQTTHTAFRDTSIPQAQNIVTGAGVKVAWLADGLDVNDPDFVRADGSHVIVDYQDFSGDGLNAPSPAGESFGDASSIAAQGRQVYDVSTFVNPAHPLPAGCTITVRGVAPGASLVGLKVFGNSNSAPTSRFIQAIDYAVNVDHVDVINESFGGNPFPDPSNDPISLADDAAVAAGVTVVSGTGDSGTNGTIGSPSSDPNVISVAGTTTFRIYAQTTFAGFQLGNGTWANDNITSLSSGGTTQTARVPDLSAPGDSGWALCSPDVSLYEECTDFAGNPTALQDFGGTSESSPLVAGAAALVIEAYEQTHGGVRPAPALVKRLLTGTATDLGYPASEQGAGEVDTLAAVQAAQSWRDGNGSPDAATDAIIPSPNQLVGVGNGGQHLSQPLTLTNASSQAQTVRLSTRTLGKILSKDTGTAFLNSATAPTFVDGFGIPRAYTRRTFHVPAGADRLDVSIASVTPISPMRIILFDPSGRFTAYSVPQGDGNFAHVDVRFPAPGRWTAFYALSAAAGFDGPIPFVITTQRFATDGTVSPATVTVPAHGTRTVTVNATLPSQVGDVSAAVLVSRGDGLTTSVPLTLRTMIPTGHKSNTFTGVVTGGNGRVQGGGPGQSNAYYLDVPPGKADLTIGFTLDKDPGDIVFGVLSGPDNQVASFQSNLNVEGDGTATQSAGFQLYVRNPVPGRYVFDMFVIDGVTGFEVAQKFTATLAFDTVKVSAPVLPDSVATTLAAGVPVKVPVKITNTGVVPLEYFADARLNTTGDLPLVEISGAEQPIPLPVPDGVTPNWQSPTEVTHLAVTARANTGVNLDINYASGSPEIYSANVNNRATSSTDAARVSAGGWAADVGQTGPFNGPAPAGHVTLTAVAHGKLFDPAVTSSTGDIWRIGIDPASDPALAALLSAAHSALVTDQLNAGTHLATPPAAPGVAPVGPVTLKPGQSTTITVTITPSAAAHSVVRGHLYVDTFNVVSGSGDELIDLPYAYTVT